MYKKLTSYKHDMAIQVLKTWFESDGYQVELEKPFYIDSVITFVPDLVLIDNGIVTAIYEVVHTHELTGRKYGLIQYWCFFNYDVTVYEVDAEWILTRTEKPDKINATIFLTDTNT